MVESKTYYGEFYFDFEQYEDVKGNASEEVIGEVFEQILKIIDNGYSKRGDYDFSGDISHKGCEFHYNFHLDFDGDVPDYAIGRWMDEALQDLNDDFSYSVSYSVLRHLEYSDDDYRWED